VSTSGAVRSMISMVRERRAREELGEDTHLATLGRLAEGT